MSSKIALTFSRVFEEIGFLPLRLKATGCRRYRYINAPKGCQRGTDTNDTLWNVGYHWSLLRQQAHPDTLLLAYLNDTYASDEPAEAVACMDTGAVK